MSNGTKQDSCLDLYPFERNRYFYGKLMTVRDFEAEQRYFNDKRTLINRLLHGQGVVCGLQVSIDPKNAAGLQISAGVAIDFCGREIVVEQDVLTGDVNDFDTFPGDDFKGGVENPLYLCLKYDECVKEPLPAVTNASSCQEVCDYNRVQERFKLEITAQPPEELFILSLCQSETVLFSDQRVEIRRIVPRWMNPGEVLEVRLVVKVMEDLAGGVEITEDFPGAPDEQLTPVLGLTTENKMVFSSLSAGETAEQGYLVRAEEELGVRTIDATEIKVDGSGVDLSGFKTQSKVEIIEDSVVDKISETHFENRSCAANDAEECIYLAEFIVDMGDEDDLTISGIDEIPFHQYVYNNPLLYKLNTCEEYRLGKLPLLAIKDNGSEVMPAAKSLDFGGGLRAEEEPGEQGDALININAGPGMEIDEENDQLKATLGPGLVFDDPENADAAIEVNLEKGLTFVPDAPGNDAVQADLGRGVTFEGNQVAADPGDGLEFDGAGSDAKLKVLPGAHIKLEGGAVALDVHHTTHESGGEDEIDVTALSGELQDPQKVTVLDAGGEVGSSTRLKFTGNVMVTPQGDHILIDILGGGAAGGGLPAIFAALANMVAVNDDTARHDALVNFPVTGSNSLLAGTLGMGADIVRSAYAMFLELFDLGEAGDAPKLGDSKLVNLAAFIRTDGYTALEDYFEERGEMVSELFQDKFGEVLAYVIGEILLANNVTRADVEFLVNRLGEPISWNGIAGRKLFIENVFQPLCHTNAPELDHPAMAQLMQRILDSAAALWKKLAEDMLVSSPPNIQIPPGGEWLFDLGDKMGTSLERILRGDGLVRDLEEVPFRVEDVLVQPGSPGATWMRSDDKISRVRHLDVLEALDDNQLPAAKPAPLPDLNLLLPDPQVHLRDAVFNQDFLVLKIRRPLLRFSIWTIVGLPASFLETLQGDVNLLGLTLPPNAFTYNSFSEMFLVQGKVQDAPLILEVSGNLSRVLNVATGAEINLNLQSINVGNPTPDQMPRIFTMSSGEASSEQASHVFLTFSDANGQVLLVGRGMDEGGQVVPWWDGEFIEWLAHFQLHPFVNVVGAGNDQIVLNRVEMDEWAFLPYLTFVEALWGANEEFYKDVLRKIMPDGIPLLTRLNAGPQIPPGASAFTFEDGQISDMFSSSKGAFMSLSDYDKSRFNLYRSFQDVVPQKITAMLMAASRQFHDFHLSTAHQLEEHNGIFRFVAITKSSDEIFIGGEEFNFINRMEYQTHEFSEVPSE